MTLREKFHLGILAAALLVACGVCRAESFGNLDFDGTTKFAVQGSRVQIDIDRIINQSSTYTSGSLQLELWATLSPYSGNSVSGYRTAFIRTANVNGLSDQLLPSHSFSSIHLDLPYTAPPSGYSHYVLFLTEYSSSCGGDGFCISAYVNYGDGGSSFTLTGHLFDSNGVPIRGATVALSGDGHYYSQMTSSDGSFLIRFDTTGIPETVAYVISKPGYIPLALPLRVSAGGSFDAGSLHMAPLGPDVTLIEVVPDLHHLGDDDFSGSVNSQFQKSAEGIHFTRSFNVTAAQRTATSATITLFAKGVELSDPMRINDALVNSLCLSPSDGSFGTCTLSGVSVHPFHVGANSIAIDSVYGDTYDDFEFTNVVIRFNGMTLPEPCTTLGDIGALSALSFFRARRRLPDRSPRPFERRA